MSIHHFTDAPDSIDADVVIVGAGISGLYCALRLAETHPDKQIVVVERLDRTGGRLDTDLIDFDGGIVVREEEGGMRFNYDMEELMRLTNKLGLCSEIVDFPMSSEGDSNRFHVRGRSFTKAWADAGSNRIWGELYELNEDERGLSPTEIVTQAFERVLAENGDANTPGRTPDQWTMLRNTYTWQGQTLNNWQMWGLLRSMGHSEECIQMLSETIGFAGPFKAPINAGDAFQILADFPKDPTYYTFRKGFSTLPDTVRDRVLADFGDRVHIVLSTNVDAIERDGDRFVFELTEAPDDRNSNPWITDGVTKRVTGGATILAVATAGLQALFASSPALNRAPNAGEIYEAIGAARGMKLMKINLYFDEPWWENGGVNPPVQFGPNFSSLPINAIYPFYALSTGSTIPDAPAALTIYCDYDNTNFWEGLQNLEPPFDSEKQRKQNDRVPQVLYGASQPVVDEAKRQLGVLFGVTSVPEPVLTSYRLWNGTDDFEFAYHQWRLGVDDRPVREFLSAPTEGVHCANEAISDMQGWVNGSLRSCDMALAHFDVEPLDNDTCVNPNDAAEVAASQSGLKRVGMGLWGG